MDSSGKKRTVTLQRNPLLINIVINCVFDNLPLKNLKACRVVCQEWNSVAVQILNEKSRVRLDSNKRRRNFLEFYKMSDTKPFPFTTFLLKTSHTEWNTEECDQLIDFFNTLRENIVTLIFQHYRDDELCLTPLMEVATNLVRLTLSSPNSAVQLNKLSKVKYLFLDHCCLSLDSFVKRIAPLSIRLKEVTFKRSKNDLQEIIINDYVDFSGCSEIEITSSCDCVTAFDMSRDIVSARKVHFDGVRVINWSATPAKVDKKMLPFEKHTGMKIKELKFGRSQLNLSLLPKSLEKLTLNRNTYGSNDSVPVELPNLKGLFLSPILEGKGPVNMSPTSYDMGIVTSMFRLCPKLVDMELSGRCVSGWRCDINVDLLPVNLKRIKLNENININLVGDRVINVDTLILGKATFADTQKFIIKIKPKIVVVELEGYGVQEPAIEIVSFVEESRNFEKIVIKVPFDGYRPVLRSYEMVLSNYVGDDGKSKWYEFTNRVGKRLTREEFKMYWFYAGP